MAQEVIRWTAPSPLWPQAIGNTDLFARQRALRQPAILRFANDEFMDQFLNLLGNDPARLKELIVKPETWRGSLPEPEPVVPAPAFARKMQRLGLIAARKKSASPVAPTEAASATVTTVRKKAQKLKLYQPAHQRYYLVTSCLVCGQAGLPDKALASAREQRVGFVIRRLMPKGQIDFTKSLPELNPGEWDKSWEEYGFVVGSDGAGWKRILNRDSLESGEEQLPLFAVHFGEDDGRQRRIFAGLVPVGNREAYMSAMQRPQTGDPAPANPPLAPPDPRMLIVKSQVIEPWKRLIERADAARIMQGITPPLNGDPKRTSADKPLSDDPLALAASLKATREQIQTGSWYALLDLAKFLEEHIGNVWQSLHGQAVSTPLTVAQTNLVTTLTNTKLTDDFRKALIDGTSQNIPISLRSALTSIRPVAESDAERIEQNLDRILISYDRNNPDSTWPIDSDIKWPNFLFPLADSKFPEGLLLLPDFLPAKTADDTSPLEEKLNLIDRLAMLIESALPLQPTGEMPALPLAAKPTMDMREGWFVIRCVFERPECEPLDPPLLSDPTVPFQMAGFFDPDAPARPIRIALPIDTTPAGLRKFDKNTAFMISDVLCGQIKRVKGLSLGDLVRSVLPWPLHKDLSVPDHGPCTSPDKPLSFGMICSLSLPIITICALLLLMIIVTLLDIIFRWIPYFLICFPLPGFKSKD